MAKTLFDHLMALFDPKSGANYYDTLSDDDKKSFNVYMLNRFLSMHMEYIDLVNQFQQYSTISESAYWKFFYAMLPKKKTFTKYIKAQKTIPIDDDIIHLTTTKFFVSSKKARESIELLNTIDEKLLNEYIESYGER